MPATPKRADKKGRRGAKFLSEVLAENLRDFRGLERIVQEELAERMQLLGHEWSRVTVSDVERNTRTVSVDELAALALCLGVTIGQLLDPAGPTHARDTAVDVGISEPRDDETLNVVGSEIAHLWARDRMVLGYFRGNSKMPEFWRELAPELHPRAQRALNSLRAGNQQEA